MVIITVVLNSWKVPKQSWQSERTGSGKEKAYDRCDPYRIRIDLNDNSVRGAGAKVCECNSYFSQRSYSEVLHQPDRSRPVTSNSSCGSWSNWLNMASSGDPSLKVVESMEELRLLQSNRRSSCSLLPSPSFYWENTAGRGKDQNKIKTRLSKRQAQEADQPSKHTISIPICNLMSKLCLS